MYVSIFARQEVDRNGAAVTNTHERNGKIVGRVVFCAVRVVSRIVGDYFFPELLMYILVYLF